MSEAGRVRLTAAVVMAMLAAAAPAAHGAERESAAGRSEPTILAVWALVDGDTPLAGARVRVLEDGRPIRRGRTHRTGASLLQLRRPPRRFTVEVTPRQDLGGRFRAVVDRYRSGRVVHVSPVTTLTARLAAHRRHGRRIGRAAARREVYRLLRVPRWHGHADLRHSDRYFNGDAYLRAARRAGGIAALNRALVRRALAGDRRAFHNRSRTARLAATNWLKLLSNPEALIAEVFKSLGTLAAKTAVEVSAHKAGETALGWMLSLFGLGEGELTKQDLEEIHEALDVIGKQLTEMKGQIDRAAFTDLVHQTDRTTGQIDYATNQLALLANVPAEEPRKATFAGTIVDYIGLNLLDAPEILDKSLGSNVPLSDNLIKSASRAAGTRSRFFGPEDSAEVESVYAYFAAYQARLAILITEYYHAKAEVYPPSLIEARVSRVRDNVTAQAASLKPPVPPNTVMDTKTGMMWMRAIDGSPLRKLTAFSELYSGGFRLTQGALSTSIPGLPFGNWAMPETQNLDVLLSDSHGDGIDYLVDKAGITRPLLAAGNWHVVVRDTFRFGRVESVPRFWRLRFNLYDLQHGAVASVPQDVDFSDSASWRAAFDRGPSVGILYRRVLGPGEEYWWR